MSQSVDVARWVRPAIEHALGLAWLAKKVEFLRELCKDEIELSLALFETDPITKTRVSKNHSSEASEKNFQTKGYQTFSIFRQLQLLAKKLSFQIRSLRQKKFRSSAGCFDSLSWCWFKKIKFA